MRHFSSVALTASLFVLAACPPPPPSPLVLSQTALPDSTAGSAYSATFEATGGTPPYAFTALGVPSGMTLDAGGALSGAAAGGGDFNLQVTVADSKGQTTSGAFPLKVFPALSFATTALPPGTTGAMYSTSLVVAGGKPPVNVSLSSGTLQTGLAFSGGTISGTPSASGIQTLTFTATDANGATARTTLDLDVRLPVSIQTTSLADGYTGRAYSAALSLAGGAAPFTWSVDSGALPAGLSLGTDGMLSGTPSAAGPTSVAVRVVDRDGRGATQTLTLAVFAPTAIATGPCPDGYRTEAYSAQWTAAGGKSPLTWSLASGALPGGLALDAASGAVSGTATTTGAASFVLSVTDANGVADTKACSLGVYDLPAVTTASPLPDLTVGANATGTFAATGGKSPLSWSLATGALPTGVTLDAATGAISGTVASTVANGQAFSFDVEVADANARKARVTFAVTAYRPPAIDTTSLADGTEYAPYGPVRLQAHDGKAPLSYAVSGLPSGLSVAPATGAISGTPVPTSRGDHPLTVTVTDAGGRTATASLTLKVRPGTPTIASANPSFGTVSGGTTVTLTGANLFGATITVGGQAIQVSVSTDGTSASFTTPPGSGPATVSVDLTNSSGLTTAAPFTYTLERTIAVDGNASDWTPAFRIGTNSGPSSWPGTDLQALYAAYDADNFYVGVAGTLDPSTGNTLVLYLDVDPGSGNGITDFSTLADDNGELDNACTNNGTGTGQYALANSRFAPELCLGTKNLTSVPLSTSWPANEQGGMRYLPSTTDYGWTVDYLGHNLVAIASTPSSGFTEFLVPWKTLYSSTGVPPAGAHLALIARIVDATGNQVADQTLPQDDDANPQRISQIAEVDIRVTPPAAAAPPWYQGSVFYELYVRSFQDSNGDGHGDLAGLTSRLDYLNDGNPATTTDLGVDAIWLMPVFESPSLHGYDTTDYEAIESDYGNLASFQAFVQAAHQRGMRVYLDLALNHTSDQHPWFLDSASSPTSAHRDWYVWSPADPGWTQPWSTDPVWHPNNGAWYYGLFFTALPDLNYRTDAVRAEMKRLASLWLQRGADGYRIDAAPYLVEDGPGSGQQHTPETHGYLKELRDSLAAANPSAAFVTESWTDTETIGRYYGSRTARGGNEAPMSFDFPLSDRIVEALNTGNAISIASKLVEVRASYPFGAVDAPFLSNHDQWRIASTLNGDAPRLRQAAALLLTLPGTPFIYYGEEVGAQNSFVSGDESHRAPMAWDSTASGGFTSGTPWTPFGSGQATANVASQTADPASLLSRYRDLIRVRRGSQALSVGQGLEVLTGMYGFDPLLVFVRTHGSERVVVAHNLADYPASNAYPVQANALDPLFVDPGTDAFSIGGNWVLSLPPHGTAIWRER